jgi:hypothetical protein
MKRTVILTIILSLCLSFSNAQTLNKLVKDQNGKAMLLGSINKEDLKSKPFKVWFLKNYDGYGINKVAIKKMPTAIDPALSNVSITYF